MYDNALRHTMGDWQHDAELPSLHSSYSLCDGGTCKIAYAREASLLKAHSAFIPTSLDIGNLREAIIAIFASLEASTNESPDYGKLLREHASTTAFEVC